MVLKAICTFIENQIKGGVLIAFKELRHLNKKTRKGFMRGRLLDMILNQNLSFITWNLIIMER
jgi:hypothetical protein